MPAMARVLHLNIQLKSAEAQFAIKGLLSLYGIWNLDFFRSFDLGICLGTGTLPSTPSTITSAWFCSILIETMK